MLQEVFYGLLLLLDLYNSRNFARSVRKKDRLERVKNIILTFFIADASSVSIQREHCGWHNAIRQQTRDLSNDSLAARLNFFTASIAEPAECVFCVCACVRHNVA